MSPSCSELLSSIRACTNCSNLPLGPRPILQIHSTAKLLIAGQAPGRKTHEKGIPFDDPSGERLRLWLGIDRGAFYNEKNVAIAPMGFCFPGTGKSGDLPPRPDCAELWRAPVLDALKHIELTLIIGRYAIDWHLPEHSGRPVTEVVRDWKTLWPNKLILPHPSPRNNRWLKNNLWFEQEIIPMLQKRVKELI